MLGPTTSGEHGWTLYHTGIRESTAQINSCLHLLSKHHSFFFYCSFLVILHFSFYTSFISSHFFILYFLSLISLFISCMFFLSLLFFHFRLPLITYFIHFIRLTSYFFYFRLHTLLLPFWTSYFTSFISDFILYFFHNLGISTKHVTVSFTRLIICLLGIFGQRHFLSF